jgi:hypothetical protein
MAKVVSIRRTDPRPPGCARALALMVEALSLLDGLVESGQVEKGTCPDLTRDLLDNAIGMLTPDDEEVAHV